MSTITLNFYEDPGHGWLEADRQMLNDLDIADQITAYSYQKGSKVYLEEDCDASVLINALKAKGVAVKFNTIYQENTPIRYYADYKV